MRSISAGKKGLVNWSSKFLLLQFSLLLSVGTSLTGCNQKSGDFSTASVEAPTLEASVSPTEQAEAKKRVESFTHAVEQGDNASIQKMLTPQFKTKLPPLNTWSAGGPYKPLLGATQWQYNLIRYTGRGKTLVVHTDYKGADGGTYRTNFAFKKDNGAWMLDQVLPPTKPRTPSAEKGAMSAK